VVSGLATGRWLAAAAGVLAGIGVALAGRALQVGSGVRPGATASESAVEPKRAAPPGRAPAGSEDPCAAERSELEAAAATHPDLHVHELDCAEPPCLLLLESTGPTTYERGVSSMEFFPLVEALGEGLPVSASLADPAGARRRIAVATLYPGELDEDLTARTRIRSERALERLKRQLAADAAEEAP